MLVCLPILTPTLASANGPSIMSAIAGGGTVSNAALKGDRLPNSRPKGEHPDAGAVTSPAAPANVGATPKRRLPIGCESAFGALVRAGNGAARCVTDLAPPNAGGVATDTKPSRQNVIFVKYPRSPFG